LQPLEFFIKNFSDPVPANFLCSIVARSLWLSFFEQSGKGKGRRLVWQQLVRLKNGLVDRPTALEDTEKGQNNG